MGILLERHGTKLISDLFCNEPTCKTQSTLNKINVKKRSSRVEFIKAFVLFLTDYVNLPDMLTIYTLNIV